MTAPLTTVTDVERLERRLERSLGQAIGDFSLIEAGDRILVGVSGGKDSWALLHLLRRLKRRAPVDFELLALKVDQGFPGFRADLIEDYLDRLLVSLSGSPRQVRHTLAEVEAHLRDAVAEGIAAGLPEDTAQAQALERIGPVHAVTGRPAAVGRPSRALLRRLTLTCALVGGAGLAAIGAPGWWAGCSRR